MTVSKKNRVYNLAKELKLDPKRIIEVARELGSSVRVPSNRIPDEVAEQIREKYGKETPKLPKNIKVVKKTGGSLIVEATSEQISNHFSGEKSALVITLPVSWRFTLNGVFDFNRFLSSFDWSLEDRNVVIDFSRCRHTDYQALSLLILYVWHLEKNRCNVKINFGEKDLQTAATMWEEMGAQEWLNVLNQPEQNFSVNKQQPLFAIRNSADSNAALKVIEEYTEDFDIEYEKTLRYIIAELLYNTLEHGKNNQIPSLLQFCWYPDKQELSFIIADLGIGIRKHLSQTYSEVENDVEAINLALKPQVSGTFGVNGQLYQSKNNAGVGLYISSNIAKRLRADMYIVSGNGLVHVSSADKTSKYLTSSWRGTFVYVTLKIRSIGDFNYQNVIAELRSASQIEMSQADSKEQKQSFYLHIKNYFGRFAEDKSLAIKLRDRELLPALASGKSLNIDFEDVELAPHSLLNALLATPVQKLGMSAYKKIKVLNASPEIRETVDFIFDENTS